VFLLPSLVLGVGLALTLGGRPGRLATVKFRLSWAVFLALGVQVVVFSRLGDGIPETKVRAVHLASYGLLLAFAAANIRVRALLPVLAGVTLNAIAIGSNGGSMPISRAAAEAAGSPSLEGTNVSTSAEHLHFLGDIFALPARLPLIANTFSIGDMLIGLGVIGFIVLTSLGPSEATLSASRIVEPLRSVAFRRLAAGRLISSVGDWLTIAALIGWIYHTTGSTGNVAVLLLVRLAPPILGGGLAGFLVDRLPKEKLVVGIELLRGIAIAVALFGVATGQLVPVFIALGFSGALATMSNAAVPSLLPGLVSDAQLPSANAVLGLAKDGAMAVGAVGAGIALSWLDAMAALGADLATFIFAALLFSRLPAPRPFAGDDAARGPGSGLRYFLARRRLLFLVLSFGAATLATGLTNASLPRFLETNLGFGAGGYGFGIAALAIGLALGQGLVGFTRVGPTAGRWIGVGLLVMSGLFVMLGMTEHAPTALLLIGLIGFVDGTTDVLFETVIQREADPRHYGAVFGFASACITTTMLGAVALAPFANELLAPHGVIIGTSVFLVAAGAIALVGMRGTHTPAVILPDPEPVTEVLRSGDDVSIITSQALAAEATAAAAELEREFSVEIVAAPALDNCDPAVVQASVGKVSKVIVFHDNSGNELLAAELAATIAEQCFHDLDAPVQRVAVDGDLAARVRDLAQF
jgi:hypothetical protein